MGKGEGVVVWPGLTVGLALAMDARTAASVSFPLSPTRPATASFSRSTITRASSGVRWTVNVSSLW